MSNWSPLESLGDFFGDPLDTGLAWWFITVVGVAPSEFIDYQCITRKAISDSLSLDVAAQCIRVWYNLANRGSDCTAQQHLVASQWAFHVPGLVVEPSSVDSLLQFFVKANFFVRRSLRKKPRPNQPSNPKNRILRLRLELDSGQGFARLPDNGNLLILFSRQP